MSDESKEDGSEEQTSGEAVIGAGNANETAEASPDVTLTISFSAEYIRERLDNNETVLALILVSTRLENVMSRGIKNHLGITKDQYETLLHNESIGTLGQLCSKMNVFGDKFEQIVIDDIAHQRRNLVHDTPEHGHNYVETLEEDENKRQEVENAIEEAIEFIEEVEV